MNPFLLTGEALREPWRLVTCHLAHWEWEHAVRNGMAMAIPFLLVRRKGQLAAVLLALAPLLSLALLPSLQGGAYGGLSGLASAAWAFTGIILVAEDRRGPGLALLGLLAAKILWEGVTGGTLTGRAEAWENLPEAHIYGAALGFAAGLVMLMRQAARARAGSQTSAARSSSFRPAGP